jgi:hypothetical protein
MSILCAAGCISDVGCSLFLKLPFVLQELFQLGTSIALANTDVDVDNYYIISTSWTLATPVPWNATRVNRGRDFLLPCMTHKVDHAMMVVGHAS